MDPFGVPSTSLAVVLATALAYRAISKPSLTKAGALTGWIVGFLLVATGLRGMTLFWFYQLGSWATRYRRQVKQQMDQTAATASVRGAYQVLAVSVLAVVLSLYHAIQYGPERVWEFDGEPQAATSSRISAAILAHHCVSLGDTLASELGMALSQPGQTVRMILPPFRKVPPGTNGGVTLGGTLYSLLGGFLCSVFWLLMDSCSGILPNDASYSIRVLWFGSLSGFLGSALDSLLGATVQQTYWNETTKQVCHSPYDDNDNNDNDTRQQPHKVLAGWVPLLSNEGVNLVSVVMTTVLGGWVLAPMVFAGGLNT